MIRLNYDSIGRVYGLPDFLFRSGNQEFEIYSSSGPLSSADDFELKLSLAQPVGINNGTFTFGYGGDSTQPIKADSCSPYVIFILLNKLPSITSAGGVNAYDNIVSFNDEGVRDPITVTHSVFGEMSGRCIPIVAGDATTKAIYRLDLKAQTLDVSTIVSGVPAGQVTGEIVITGTPSVAQHERVTISRPPSSGKIIFEDGSKSTSWLPYETSSYQLECAMEAADIDGLIVAKSKTGDSVSFEFRREDAGVFNPITFNDTFSWPSGIKMELNLSAVRDVIDSIGFDGHISAVLQLKRNGEIQFEQPVRLKTPLQSAGTVI